MTPARTPARKPTPARTSARKMTPARTAATRSPARPAPDPMVTPPPDKPLPPARARGYTPLRTSDPEHTPIATPLPGDPRPAPGRVTPSRPMPGGASPLHSTMRGPVPAPTPRRPSQPMAEAGRATPRAPQPSQNRARQSGPRPAVVPETPAYGVQRPPPQDFALARTMAAQWNPTPALAPAAPNRVHRETARVQFRPQRQWGGAFLVFVLLLAAAAVVVHVKYIPLDVLISWRQPTGLAIATEPPGAKLRLDGVPLAATAPTTVTIWRDTNDHVIEAVRPGYQVARETIRYDKSTSLSFLLRLQPAPSPTPDH